MMSIELFRPTREYIDVDNTFQKHPANGNLAIKKRSNSVRQSVMNLLTTRKGDKPFHPEIYSPIYDYLFELGTVTSAVLLEKEIVSYLTAYEPRLVLYSVTVTFPATHYLNCEISGEIINTLEPFNVSLLVDRLR
jgi:phage baseplate assembly protein W